MRNIVLIVSDISRNGGTERAAVNLANMLSKDNKVTILSVHNLDDVIIPFFELKSDIRLRSLKLHNKWSGFNFVNNFFYLSKFFKKESYDLVLGFWHGISLLLPFLGNSKMKVIACEHADFDANSNLIKFLMRRVYNKLDGLVVLSKLAQEKMCMLNRNLIVIPNSLPFEVNVQSLLMNERILMVGRIVSVKGYERVLPLAMFLQKEFPSWKIDIFGDGELKESLLSEVKKNGLFNIEFFSSVKNIQKEYLKSSIFLSTSYNEALPMVFIEAMSCGVPVVSYHNEGALSLIGDNGFIVVNNDELVKVISMLINNVDLRKKYGKKGKQKSLEYTTEEISLKWNSYLSDFH